MFHVAQAFLYCLFALLTANFSHGASLESYGSRSVTETGLVSRAANFGFTNSKWIWTSEVVNGVAPPGTLDNEFTLYVNGAEVGTGYDFQFAERFCVKLKPYDNVFALRATNTATVPNPAYVIAAIQVTYSDGTTDMIVTDATWRTNLIVIPGFEQPGFDDSSWPNAVVYHSYSELPPVAIPSDPATVSFTNTFWIWTDETVNQIAPVGARAFRRTYTPPSGQIPTSATILITTDNEYSLYVNGRIVGSGTQWPTAQRYTVNLQSGSSDVVFAVYAVNQGGPAGLLVSIEINAVMPGCDCTAGAYVISDGIWKANTGVPTGFQLPGFNDASWPAATVITSYGSPYVWGTINVPTSDSPPSGPLPGAPA